MRNLCFAVLALAFSVPAHSQSMTIAVDATNAPRKILHATLTLPAQPGEMTLVYPKWIPGEHAPTGPIVDFAGLKMSANGHEVRWRRDSVDMYAFHLIVPAGANQLDVQADYLDTAAASGFSAGASSSANLVLLSWNELLLYPQGAKPGDIQVKPSLKLPEGWKFGTALTQESGSDNRIHFAQVSLEELIDSPVLAGLYFKEVPLAVEVEPKHFLDLAADGPEDLAIKPEMQAAFDNLVREAGALYRSRHYHSYHFLVTLSDQVAHFGLEHHQSSDDRVPEKTFLDDGLSLLAADLLPHEFTHSWNGKYRRPDGLATANYQDPMQGDLLWVYEGMTQYWGEVLAARSGIQSADQYKSYLASVAANLNARPGRTWRDLQDTATAAQLLYFASGGWDNWRRGVDYYAEGELIWLDADTLIRERSKGKRSLNDFAGTFLAVGGNLAPSDPPKVLPYTFNDVVAGLNAVEPYDWTTFFREHLDTLADHAPLGGIVRGGYKLDYTDAPSEFERANEAAARGVDAWYSLGLKVAGDGVIADVLYGGLADKAGFGPEMTIVAVNGRKYSPELLHQVIHESQTSQTPLEFIVENTGYFHVLKINYHDGEKYPQLVRVGDKPASLDAILQPLVKAKK